MDAVYMVKPSDKNEELRYSLRTLVNAPFIRQVVIVGYLPSWIQADSVYFIPREQRNMSKYINTTNNLLRACGDRHVSEDFMLMNDDFFIMKHIDGPPNYHRGPLVNMMNHYYNKGDTGYSQGVEMTMNYLKDLGITKDLKSYELHVPMVFNQKKFYDLIKKQRREVIIPVVHKRTLYGNFYNVGGEQLNDCKIIDDSRPPESTFLSTIEGSFERYKVGDYIRNRFPNKSIYEL